ncbi:MAG: hypothetical protein OH316_01360 [Candidatus Parvarchaeota archaeon]|nr:hypothetical protein [Candidatus Parvarchaeota archaeon]
MAETGGEAFVLMMLTVIVVVFIFYIFGQFLLLGFNFSSASLCYVSSNIRNYFYNDLCLTQFFCISSFLSSMHLTPPMLGCSTTVSTYAGNYPTSAMFTGITNTLSTCFYQYGAFNHLSVFRYGPQICSVVNIRTDYNFSFYNFTKYLNSTTYTKVKSCIGYTASQACPHASEGFSCDSQAPTTCTMSESNYFTCKVNGSNYVPNYPNYNVVEMPLNASKGTLAADNNASLDLCVGSQGCTFNRYAGENGLCENATGYSNVCTQYYTNFCNVSKNTCYMNYDPVTDSVLPPPSCTLSEPVFSNATTNETYFDYFQPGVDLFFSYYNTSSGKKAVAVNPLSKMYDLQKSTLYVVYLNSMTGTRFPPVQIHLPSECVQGTFINNYPTTCYDYCARSALVYGSALAGVAALNPGPMLVTGAFAAGAFSGAVFKEASGYGLISSSISQAALEEAGALFSLSGLPQCASCLLSSFTNPASVLSGASMLGRNIIYVCAVTS